MNRAYQELQKAAVELQGAQATVEQLREQAIVLDLAQVLVRDMDSRIVQWNLGAERLYGFSKEEAVGRISHELFKTQFPEPPSQIEDTLRRTGKWEGELVHRKRDGGRLIVSSQWILHRDSVGCPVRILEANTDVTERMNAQQVLQESEERFRTMANSIPQLSWIAQADGYVYWYNQRWYEYTGTTPEQMEGWGWQSVHDPLVLPKVLERWLASIATGELFDMEFPLRGADGLFRGFLTRVLPLKNAEGRVVQWFGTNTDITERMRAEEKVRALNANLEERTVELKESARELGRSNRDLQQFAYVASHDLQEPLRMVVNFTQLLAKRYRDQLDQDAHDFIEYAVDGATRMQTLISDLLNYARVGTQGTPFKLTDCEAVLEQVIANLRFAIVDSGAVVTHDSLPVVMGDDTQLSQLFQNLLSNAVKFRGENSPRVHVSSERNGNHWKISVQDNGIGIPPEYRERIFLIFQRLHTKAEYPGTGIGLAISQKIVEEHGGRLWIESPPQGGSTFNFTLVI